MGSLWFSVFHFFSLESHFCISIVLCCSLDYDDSSQVLNVHVFFRVCSLVFLRRQFSEFADIVFKYPSDCLVCLWGVVCIECINEDECRGCLSTADGYGEFKFLRKVFLNKVRVYRVRLLRYCIQWVGTVLVFVFYVSSALCAFVFGGTLPTAAARCCEIATATPEFVISERFSDLAIRAIVPSNARECGLKCCC